jgi:hypothetical protein
MFAFSPLDLCVLAIIVALSVMAAVEAAKKGYYPLLWVFTAGLIGLLILAFLPFVNEKSNLPEAQRQSRRKLGNLIGSITSAVVLASVVVKLLV